MVTGELSDNAGGSSPERVLLESWLNKLLKIRMSDGRVIVGVLLCTDDEMNVILGQSLEYVHELDGDVVEEPRSLGLSMVPGKHIVNIEVDLESGPTAATAPAVEELRSLLENAKVAENAKTNVEHA